jgi:hypothetical protein
VDDPKFLDAQCSAPIAMIEPGNRIYILTGSASEGWVVGQNSEWKGFIVGGIVRVKEDDGDMFGPSALVPDPPVKQWTMG